MDSIIIERFKQLSLIPRPSKQMDGVRTFIFDWAKQNKLQYRTDLYGNTVVIAGDENTKTTPIIIQSHMDMVATKADSSNHNFSTDPIEVIVDSDQQIMKANQTTLGADNGVGLVSGMVLVEELLTTTFFQDHVIYLLMTSDEEIGCVGAENIDPFPFLPKKAYMINVDSEVDGQICAGSTGGSDCHIVLPKTDITVSESHQGYKLTFNSFTGGHSGLNINDGRASAIKTLVHFIHQLQIQDPTLAIHSFTGGNAHNAIPVSAEIVFLTTLTKETISLMLETYMGDVKIRYNESNIQVELTHYHGETVPCSPQLIDILLILHQGIIDNNPHNKACVETSTNIGVVTTLSNGFDINILSRSSSESAMKEYHNVLECIGRLFNCSVTPFKMYSGWNPDWNQNYVLNVLKRTYYELFGKSCDITKVHAGLETSILINKYPEWICMSIGPSIINAHTPNEYIILSTIQPFYLWLKTTVLKLNMN